MRYINKLQKEKENLELQVKTLQDGLQRIRTYLSLPKFYPSNNYVNPKDILLRIDEIKSEVIGIEIAGSLENNS